PVAGAVRAALDRDRVRDARARGLAPGAAQLLARDRRCLPALGALHGRGHLRAHRPAPLLDGALAPLGAEQDARPADRPPGAAAPRAPPPRRLRDLATVCCKD